MSLHLSPQDLARCESVSRTLLSPLAAPSVDAWRADVTQALRALFGADGTVFLIASQDDPFYSADAPDVVDVVYRLTASHTAEQMRFHDPVVNAWNDMRREQHVNAFSWQRNAQMIATEGLAMEDSPMVQEALIDNGILDFDGVYTSTASSESMLWMLYERQGTSRFGEDARLLYQMLLPAFDAGINAVARFFNHREALDLLQEPVALVGPEGQHLHRNAALERLLDADPERDWIVQEMDGLTRRLQPFARERAADAPAVPPQQTVRTHRATYTLRGTFVGPGFFTGGSCTLLAVSSDAGPTLPDAETVRVRYGLTRREAEVALLLAEGLSNDALAERLFISPHTARRHTENVLAKLGLNTRKALALKLMQGSAT